MNKDSHLIWESLESDGPGPLHLAFGSASVEPTKANIKTSLPEEYEYIEKIVNLIQNDRYEHAADLARGLYRDNNDALQAIIQLSRVTEGIEDREELINFAVGTIEATTGIDPNVYADIIIKGINIIIDRNFKSKLTGTRVVQMPTGPIRDYLEASIHTAKAPPGWGPWDMVEMLINALQIFMAKMQATIPNTYKFSAAVSDTENPAEAG